MASQFVEKLLFFARACETSGVDARAEPQVYPVLATDASRCERFHQVASGDAGGNDHRVRGECQVGDALLEREKLTCLGAPPLGVDEQDAIVLQDANACRKRTLSGFAVASFDRNVPECPHENVDARYPPQFCHGERYGIPTHRSPQEDRVGHGDVVASDDHSSLSRDHLSVLDGDFEDTPLREGAQKTSQ